MTNNENLDNMVPWFKNVNIIFGDKDKTIYNNLSFDGTPLNETIEDKSNN